MVEGTALETRQGRKALEGSNPSLSAHRIRPRTDMRGRICYTIRMQSDPSKSLGPGNIGFLILAGVFFDVVSFVPFVNLITDFLAGVVVFPLWFWLSGVSYTKNKKLLASGAITLLFELVPFISVLPGWTFGVVFNIVMINRKAKRERLELEKAEAERSQAGAFASLRDQRTRTLDEDRRLNRAREVMRTGLVRPGEQNDPVIQDALQKRKERQRREEGMAAAGPELSEAQKDEMRRRNANQRGLDAYEALRMDPDRTPDSQAKLRRAEEIRDAAVPRVGELDDPALRAAYERRRGPDAPLERPRKEIA